MRRARTGVASGIGTVGLGVVASAVLTYLFLSLAGRSLGPVGFAPVSTLWAMVFIVGPGLFLPLQQELGRLMGGQREARAGGRALRRVAVLAAAMASGTALVTLAASGWIADRLLGGERGLLWCFLGAVLSYAVMFLARGVFSGLGDFSDFARLVVVESIVRLAVGGGLALLGGTSAVDFGIAIAVAPVVSVLVVTGLGRRFRLPPGKPVAWRATAAGLGWLVAGALLAQLLANAGPLAVQLLASEEQAGEAGRFLSALVVARIALYFFQAAQAALLPNLAELVAAGEAQKVRRAVRDLVLVCTALTVLSTVAAGLLGHWVVSLLFGADFAVTGATMAMLTGASGVYVLAAALSQAVIAAGGHRSTATAWLVGCVALAAGTTLAEDLFLRVQLGYLLGSCAAALVLAAALPRRLRDVGAGGRTGGGTGVSPAPPGPAPGTPPGPA